MYLARPVFVIVFAILPVVACRPRQPPTPAGTTAADSDAAAATACANERTTQEHDLLQLLGAPASWAGKDGAATVQRLRNIAARTAMHGDFATAEGLMRCTLRWLEAYRAAVPQAAVRKWDVERAWTQITLAEILSELNQSNLSLPLVRTALAVLEKEAGQPQSEVTAPDLALNRSQLADALCDQPKPSLLMQKEAFSLYQMALQVLRPTTSAIASQVLNNYARCLIQFSGPASYDEADQLLHEAMHRINAKERAHPDLVRPLNNLAWLRLRQQRRDEALIYARHVLRLTERRLRQEGPALSESGLNALLGSLYRDEQNLYSVIAHLQELQEHKIPLDPKTLRGWQQLALATVLWRKQRSLDVQAQRIKLFRAKAQVPELRSRIDAYIENQSRLAALSAALTFSNAQLSDQIERSRQYTKLSLEIDAQEKELSTVLAPEVRAAWLGDNEDLREAPESIIDVVRMALPEDTALVELVSYQRRPFTAGSVDDPAHFPAHYQAFVLTRQGELTVRDLNEAAPIDGALTALRAQLERPDSAPEVLLAAERAAFERILRPLWSSTIKDHPRWLLALDGLATQLPVAVLDDGAGPLIARYSIGYLEAGRHLQRAPTCTVSVLPPSPGEVVCVPHHDAVLVADHDYGPPMSELRPGCPQNVPEERMPPECRDPLPWLPGSLQEATTFHRYIPNSSVLQKKQATKRAVLDLHAPGILLISTHGKSSVPNQVLTDARGGFPAESPGRLLVPINGAVVDPYLRSVLALAGARMVYRQPPLPDQSVGVLSAREVLNVNLQGTQLVILSACETGLGDIRVSQGVIGHRRAFLAAGSETVVSSLWQVNDDSTQKLMSCFIKQLSMKVGRIDALNNAARALRTDPRYAHPYFWAPFVATGERRPLEAFVFADGSVDGEDPCRSRTRKLP